MIGLTRETLVALLFFMCTVGASAQSLLKPSPLLPEIIAQFPTVRDLTISKTEEEVYFTVQSPAGELSSIVFLKKVNGNWTQPEVAPFSGRFNDLEPFFSPDDLRLYFASNRQMHVSSSTTKDYDIWLVERKNVNSPWSHAVNVGSPVNSDGNEFYPSITKSGNLYFTSDGRLSKGKDDIFVCKWNMDHFEAPVSLSDSVNSEGYEFNAFVSSDESYIIYTCYNRKGGLGSGDLYISYNLGGGNWSAAKNMGENINSPQMDYCPYVFEKTGTMYFTSKRSGIKPDHSIRHEIADLKKQINRYDNGLSRIYSLSIKDQIHK